MSVINTNVKSPMAQNAMTINNRAMSHAMQQLSTGKRINSAADDAAWRKVLDYFSSATQIGLTATPKETKEISNIEYFGDPIYTYSLRQGISDGFLAPYKVVRIGFDRDLDGWREDAPGVIRIGTTRRGIGPAYADKAFRTGLRTGDLLKPDLFAEKLTKRIKENNAVIKELGEKPLSPKEVVDESLAAGQILAPFITNTVVFLHEALAAKNSNMLFEGAQGTFLDIDHGTYPYVTSSNTTSGGACTGSGVPPNRIDHVMGVLKAYTTRVGEGPFPTEDSDLSKRFHSMGREFGATTGRARRCGWFDAVSTKYSVMINGIDQLAITNLDGLDEAEWIKVCVGYRIGSKKLDFPPTDSEELALCKPVYIDMPGWRKPTENAREFSDLPQKARNYVKKIAGLVGANLSIVSIGPGREQTIRL